MNGLQRRGLPRAGGAEQHCAELRRLFGLQRRGLPRGKFDGR